MHHHLHVCGCLGLNRCMCIVGELQRKQQYWDVELNKIVRKLEMMKLKLFASEKICSMQKLHKNLSRKLCDIDHWNVNYAQWNNVL